MASLFVDMAAFEGDFNDGVRYHEKMSNQQFELLDTLKIRIDDIGGIIDMNDEIRLGAREELESLDRIEQSLRETLRALEDRKRPLMKMSRDAHNENYNHRRKVEELKRALARLLAEISAQERLKNQHHMLSENLADAPWAQRALPHQWDGAFRLASSQRAILGDKPGLGKTLQAVMTADMLRELGTSKKVLVFCPKPVLDGFEREFKSWSSNRIIQVLNQSGKGVDQSLKSSVLEMVKILPECVVITNYEVWRKQRSLIDQLIECQFDTLFLDEAHILKDGSNATSKGIREIVRATNKCEHCGAFATRNFCTVCGGSSTETFSFRSVKNVFPMTGTVLLNKPQDLANLLNIVDEQAFPSETAFLRDYCRQYENSTGQKRWTFKHGGAETLLTKLGMRYTARDRDSAGVVMPPQEYVHHEIEANDERYEEYWKAINEMRNDAIIAFKDGELSGFDTLEWYTRIRQMTVWPADFKIIKRHPDTGEVLQERVMNIRQSPIMDEAERVIRDALDAGDRIVVFCKFKTALKEMQHRLEKDDISLVRYDGDLNDNARLIAQHDFDPRMTPKGEHIYNVFLGQYDSTKQGINLDGAQQVVFLDREWNPAMEEQARDRVRRIGSKDNTIVHSFHAEGTATELLDALHIEKEAMLKGFEDVDMTKIMRKFLGLED